jgi:hypothetical protein
VLVQVLSYALWTGRLSLLLVVVLGFKRAWRGGAKPPRPRLVLAIDVLTLLLISSWATYLILMCDDRLSLTARMQAYRQWGLEPEATRQSSPHQFAAELRDRYILGTTVGHLGLQLIVLPVLAELRRRVRSAPPVLPAPDPTRKPPD